MQTHIGTPQEADPHRAKCLSNKNAIATSNIECCYFDTQTAIGECCVFKNQPQQSFSYPILQFEVQFHGMCYLTQIV